MSEELEVFGKLAKAETAPDFSVPFTGDSEAERKITQHKVWLKTIRHLCPCL